MARTAQHSGLSPEAFLEWERAQADRHEYFRGEVFAMAGGSPRHNALSAGVNAALHGTFRPPGCLVLSSDQKLGPGPGERYVYADVTVVCDGVRLEQGTSDVVANPGVIVEVLSGSTEQYDRGQKWEGYQRIGSLTDYILVSQSEPRIEHFCRDSGGTWTYRAAGPGGRITLTCGAELNVDAVFTGMFDVAGE